MKYLLQIFFLTIPFLLQAQQLYEQKIYPFDGESPDQYGRYIAVNDSFLFVSSIGHNNYSGAVYVYKKYNNNWIYQKKLINSDNAAFDRFGTVHLYKNYLYVGALSKRVNGVNGAGAVYVFKYENGDWIETQKILPDSIELDMNFGFKISAREEYLLVSAHEASPLGTRSGKAFLYKKYYDSYKLYQTFIPGDGDSYDNFGVDLLIIDSTIIIGAPRNANSSGEWAGAVYIFEKRDSLWIESYKILPDANSDFDYFGGALKTSNKYLTITAMVSILGKGEGSVYIYERSKNSFKFIQKITAGLNPVYNNYFGYSLVMNDDSMYVGAISDITDSASRGAVYFFQNKNGIWEKSLRIIANEVHESGTYGHDVLFRNNQLFIGSPDARTDGVRMGAVYIYSSEPLSVENDNINLSGFIIEQNYPNPFNSQTVIEYTLPRAGFVIVKLFDITGREVKTISEEMRNEGKHSFVLDIKGLASGVYFYRVTFMFEEGSKIKYSSVNKKAVLVK
jgi:hypothetical protein